MRLIAAGMLLLVLTANAAAAPKATQVSYANGTATIDIYIEVFGEGASDALAAKWEALIEQTWNGAFREHGCDCFQIVVDAHVNYNSEANHWRDVADGWEGWEVRPRESWEADDPKWLPSVGFATEPAENSDRFEGEAGPGELALDEPWVVVHEAGHLMGHDEAYYFPPGWKKGDNVLPKSGWDGGNLMAGPKIDLASWSENPSGYFSAKNYEEVMQAIVDYLREQGQSAPSGVAELKVSLDFSHDAWGPSGPANKNSETAHAELDLCVLFFKGQGETSISQGTMHWSHGRRIGGTWYGGNRTVNNPFPVTVTGRYGAGSDGFPAWTVELDPHDLVSNYLKNGKVYGTGGHLYYAFEHSQLLDSGKTTTGSLKRIELSPLDFMVGQKTTPVKIESPVNQNVQTVGGGLLTLERSILVP